MAKVAWFIYKLLLNPNGGATKFFLNQLHQDLPSRIIGSQMVGQLGNSKLRKDVWKKLRLWSDYMMLQLQTKMMLKWGSMKLGHIFFTDEFYLLGPDMLEKGKIHILPPRAGNSSPISLPEIISSWDHLRPRHWWTRRDSCGEFQCRARSGIHVGSLSLCFGSGCFLIYTFPQIADCSMVYTCMWAVVEDLTGLIDQFLLSCCFQNCWGNLWVTGGYVGWIPLVSWMCDWTVFTKASCSWHASSLCSFTHSNHESFAAGRCRTPMATSITLRSWWKDWFEKLPSNFQWEVWVPNCWV